MERAHSETHASLLATFTMKKISFALLAASALAQIDHPNFAQQQVLRVEFNTREGWQLLQELQNVYSYDVLQLNAQKGHADIMLERDDTFLPQVLTNADINYQTVVENFQDLIDWERDLIKKRRQQHALSKDAADFDLQNYHTYDEIISYLNDLSGTILLGSKMFT